MKIENEVGRKEGGGSLRFREIGRIGKGWSLGKSINEEKREKCIKLRRREEDLVEIWSNGGKDGGGDGVN